MRININTTSVSNEKKNFRLIFLYFCSHCYIKLKSHQILNFLASFARFFVWISLWNTRRGNRSHAYNTCINSYAQWYFRYFISVLLMPNSASRGTFYSTRFMLFVKHLLKIDAILRIQTQHKHFSAFRTLSNIVVCLSYIFHNWIQKNIRIIYQFAKERVAIRKWYHSWNTLGIFSTMNSTTIWQWKQHLLCSCAHVHMCTWPETQSYRAEIILWFFFVK